MNRILQGDVLSFARHYKGEPFHALLCDAPYHLTSITDRFGKEDAAPAQEGNDGAFKRLSTGFMGKSWDGGDIAFRPETWRAFWNLLYPGAFGMTFGGSRTAHRMAVAIEDAGFILHPQIGYVFGSGFPKATRIKKDGEIVLEFEGHRYGLQTLKPAMEIIIVFQKPYTEKGRPVDDITRTGAGALWIEGGRIGVNQNDDNHRQPSIDFHKGGNEIYGDGLSGRPLDNLNSQGRWPANFIIQHSPDCKQVGTSLDGYTINRFTDGAKPFGDAIGEEFESEQVGNESAVWQCVDGCPARELDRQSGHLKSGAIKVGQPGGTDWSSGNISHERNAGRPVQLQNIDANSGGASRFFFNADYAFENLESAALFKYQAKAAVTERELGLIHHIPCIKCGELHSTHHLNDKGEDELCRRNEHPTIKTISLIRHLATLLLPPEAYAPRRLFVPFAGTASEMIGAHQAGWEHIIGVEKEAEYVEIAKARLDYWQKQGTQLELL